MYPVDNASKITRAYIETSNLAIFIKSCNSVHLFILIVPVQRYAFSNKVHFLTNILDFLKTHNKINL